MIIRAIISIALTALFAGGASAADKRGTIRSDETWSGEIRLTGDVTVAGGKVTILPGTRVYGDNSLKIQGAGVIHAVGTPAERITFNQAQIIVEALTNDDDCFFQYCNFENEYNVMEFRNPAGVTELSTLRIDNCFFWRGSYCHLYVTSGGSPKITNCHFEEAASGIFCHGADVIEVSNTSFTNVSCGIICGSMGGQSYEPMRCLVDHCVFYGIHDERAVSGVSIAKGYGICTVNEPGTLSIQNCIFQDIAEASIREWNIEDPKYGEWTVLNDYNCHYDVTVEPFYLRDPGGNSIEVDPRMKDPDSDDYSLDGGSPCAGTGSDGSDMGLNGGGLAAVRGRIPPTATALTVTVGANPVTGPVSLSVPGYGWFTALIVDVTGMPVRRLAGSGGVTWDGRDAAGRSVGAGTYLTEVVRGDARAFIRLVKMP